jgi:hypothetical protein
MSNRKSHAIGRVNPDTGELEFQGSNKQWISSGVSIGVSGEIKRHKPKPRAIPPDPIDEKIRTAMYGLCELRAGIE